MRVNSEELESVNEGNKFGQSEGEPTPDHRLVRQLLGLAVVPDTATIERPSRLNRASHTQPEIENSVRFVSASVDQRLNNPTVHL